MIMSSSTVMPAVSSSVILPLHQPVHAKAVEETSLSNSSDDNASPRSGKHSDNKQQQQNNNISKCRPDLPPTIRNIPTKPLRPLTAYHIFFQIEREYIIQTLAKVDGDTASDNNSNGTESCAAYLDNKICLPNVPHRYRNTRLSRDWHAGPGKRRKRKHRKQHGKIGFLELSRLVSTRWARLEELDPETLRFVRAIARKELEDYYQEMKDYKKAISLSTSDAVTMPSTKRKGNMAAKKKKAARSSRSSGPPKQKAAKKRSSKDPNYMVQHRHDQRQRQQQSLTMTTMLPEMVSSCDQAFDFMHPTSVQLKREIDDFLSLIDNKVQHDMNTMKMMNPFSLFGNTNQVQRQGNDSMFQQRQNFTMSMLQPFDSRLEESSINRPLERRIKRQSVFGTASTNKTASPCASPSEVEVDICDDEILKLWKSHN
mmetsp:Transcript_38597/g.80897  ORF Transcript_38597/g.80897 Transcript_38597/m.80897 type:complete len:427 (-) Transcript_38597:126-1406(-)